MKSKPTAAKKAATQSTAKKAAKKAPKKAPAKTLPPPVYAEPTPEPIHIKESPFARGTHTKADRHEIREITHRVMGSRQSQRPVERHDQARKKR